MKKSSSFFKPRAIYIVKKCCLLQDPFSKEYYNQDKDDILICLGLSYLENGSQYRFFNLKSKIFVKWDNVKENSSNRRYFFERISY